MEDRVLPVILGDGILSDVVCFKRKAVALVSATLTVNDHVVVIDKCIN